MVDPTRDERGEDGRDLKSAARDRGMEQLEGVKGQLAEGAERVAAAVERTADELESDGDAAVSGFGHSLANVMRQMAGGLRERDIEAFAGELGALARRNPGVFLAGSVALGFGVARFFKARPSRPSDRGGDGLYRADEPGLGDRDGLDRVDPLDPEESLDLSGNPSGFAARGDDERERLDGLRGSEETAMSGEEPSRSRARGRSRAKSRTATAQSSAPDTAGGSASPNESMATSSDSLQEGKTP